MVFWNFQIGYSVWFPCVLNFFTHILTVFHARNYFLVLVIDFTKNWKEDWGGITVNSQCQSNMSTVNNNCTQYLKQVYWFTLCGSLICNQTIDCHPSNTQLSSILITANAADLSKHINKFRCMTKHKFNKHKVPKFNP